METTIMENQMERKWKMKWKLGEYRGLYLSMPHICVFARRALIA